VKLARNICAVLVLTGAAGFAGAQETTGTFTGSVSDQTGAVLPGVTVTIRNVNTGFRAAFNTTTSGTYAAPVLPVGTYDLEFSLSGFETFARRGVVLHVNDRLAVNATLNAGGVSEAIEVTAGGELIQQTSALQSLMSARQVQELPLNNRNFVQLATLVPGVSSDLGDEVGIGLTSTVSVSINGARRNAVNWLVDGVSNVDVGSNITLLATPTVDSIEEFKILTSSYAAEWQRSGGGVVNLVTKSGTNQFKGSLYEYYRNDSLNENSFFRKQSSDPLISQNAPALDYHNFGWTLGGPIRKDKLFFFVSQEWRRIKRAASPITSVPQPAWLTDPTNANYVAPADRDLNAVALLAAWPQPNNPAVPGQYVNSSPGVNNTRQEVARLDYNISANWRAMARYTHDLSETEDVVGALFLATTVLVPNVASTITPVPGNIFVARLTGNLGQNTVNEVSYQFSSNAITSRSTDAARGRRADYGLDIPEVFAGNDGDRIPFVRITGLSAIGANQAIGIKYRNHTFADDLTMLRGNHTFKVGGLVSFESKDENAANLTQGDFTFGAGGGRTAFQNFLRGNSDGLCGAACIYSEAEVDITNHLRFRRYEGYVQDSWRVTPKVTIDAGLRYAVYPGVIDANDVMTSFAPSLYDPANAPTFSSTAGTAIVVGTGDPLNGIVIAGRNAPGGRRLYKADKGNVQPRLGLTFDPKGDGKSLFRAGFGIYYDQVLVGIFEQNAFTNPPFASTRAFQNTQLSSPAAGITPTTTGVRNLIATGEDFKTPRFMQWNVGLSRLLYARGALDVSYVGSRGDFLVQPVDINQPQPADVVRLASLNLARPFLGYGSINNRQTTARSRYHGLLVDFRHNAGAAGTFALAYTLSQGKATASNDRDAVDLPQNPQDLGAEYALARTDRTHVFKGNWVYEIPVFRNSAGVAKAVLGGWQVAGIYTRESGPPVSRIVTGNTNGGRRGLRVNQLSDPFANLPAGNYYINPAAFAPPADGAYGDTGRAIFRLPGRNQWDITLSKFWNTSQKTRLQFRADFINAFNKTQFTTVNNVCNAGLSDSSCAIANNSFGQFDGVRLAREIQLSLKLFFN
jgi:hypothetical protein